MDVQHVHAVLFDLDGTLIDTERQYTQFWSAMGREYVPDIHDFAQRIKGVTLKQMFAEYFPNEAVRKEVREQLMRFEDSMTYQFVPRVTSFIDDLHRHGVKCAVVTSSDRAKIQSVRRKISGFDTYFDAVLVAEDFKLSKPDPDCYITACKRLGVDFGECLIFEDALSGLQAGVRSSILTVGVEGTYSADELGLYCDVVISSFADIDYAWAEEVLIKRKYISKAEQAVLSYLDAHNITYDVYHHPEGKTIAEASRWWHDDGSIHCKNIFLRNHRGNQHYLVCFSCLHDLSIHNLESRLKNELMSAGFNSPGKLSFASSERLNRYLGVSSGSVSPFGLIHDTSHHVILFLDENLRKSQFLSFHPNDCRATVVIRIEEFERYLEQTGNSYRYMQLYD